MNQILSRRPEVWASWAVPIYIKDGKEMRQ